MLVRTLRCMRCQKQMVVSTASHNQNPYCDECLEAHLAEIGRSDCEWTLVGDYEWRQRDRKTSEGPEDPT